MTIEDCGNWCKVGKNKIVLVYVSAECASVTLCLVFHDPFVDLIAYMLVTAAAQESLMELRKLDENNLS